MDPAVPVNAPQIVTVVPAPIWLELLPQLEGLLNQAGVCGLVVQAPCALPVGVMYTLVADEKPKADRAKIKASVANGFRSPFKTFLH